MPDLIYRLDPDGKNVPAQPATADEARQLLIEGNQGFVKLFREAQVVHVSPNVLGQGKDGGAPVQQPFAAVLGCSDARVPTELIFRCTANQLFVVRVAGNVPGEECLGSLEYATENLAHSLRLTVVLGHTGCGAVGAAVDSYRDPVNYPRSNELRAVVDRILPGVRIADRALTRVYGVDRIESADGREALVEMSVVMNAALTGMTVYNALHAPVEFGVFDLVDRKVILQAPPRSNEEVVELAARVATSDRVTQHL